MIKIIKAFFKTEIIKVFSFTAISTLVRMLTGLISVTVVSVIIGPSGIALLGQLNNFSTIILNISSGGLNNGITKYVAEYKESDSKIKLYISTAFSITIYCSLACGLFMIIFNEFLSNLIMLSYKYDYVFLIFGLTIIFYSLNMLLMSILNGFKEYNKFVIVNIISSVVGLLFTVFFVFFMGIKGALISAVTYQSLIFFVSLWMVRKMKWLSKDYLIKKIDYPTTKKYFNYAIMSLVTILTAPVVQLLLRANVISNISEIEAGWWEAMNRVSGMYLMIITTSFSVFYLPKLSETKSNIGIKREIFQAYKVIIPIISVGFFLIYMLRVFIVETLFNSEFMPMIDLFLWQLIGDFFKISSWILAFLMIAKSMTKTFVFFEILFSLVMLSLGFVFLEHNGIIGLTQAYAFNYLFYFACMIILFRGIVFLPKKSYDEK